MAGDAISLLDGALSLTLEPVTIMQATGPSWANWVAAAAALVAGLATFVTAVIAWKAYTFAIDEIGERARLETFSKSQEAAAALLIAGFGVVQKVMPLRRKWQKPDGTKPTPDQIDAARTATLSFEARAHVLGAYFPDQEPVAYAIIKLSKAFTKGVRDAFADDEPPPLLGRLRVDLGPFLRGPTPEEMDRVIADGIVHYKEIAGK